MQGPWNLEEPSAEEWTQIGGTFISAECEMKDQ
jgi:hypothetical protein